MRFAFLGLCLFLTAGFAALGVWQLERREWKLALIDRVETRLAAPPRSMPPFSAWSAEDAYTRVTVSGVYLHDRETLVQAVTELGPGWWVMTPLRTEAGVVLVNRGFAPSERREPSSQNGAAVTVTGLLRASEPRGAFLRANAPAEERWHSRDVLAIAEARGLAERVAPFFIDADASLNAAGDPVGGLTVVRFRNSHLVYALVWFALAALSLAGAARVALPRRRAAPKN